MELRITRNGIAAAFVAVLLLALSGCVAPGAGSQTSFWAFGWGWSSLVLLAMGIMAALLAIAYMASVALDDEQMKAWTKKEVGQLGYSALIFAVALLLVGNMDGWLKLLSYASPSPEWQGYVNNLVCCDPAEPQCLASPAAAKGRPCHVALATDYLQTLYKSAELQASSDLLFYTKFSLLSNVAVGGTLTALIDLASASVRPLAGLSILMELYGLLIDLTFKTMVFIRLQQVLLEYIWLGFFPLMMSLGLVLRTFHFSRKLGGLLIALGLAAYVVLPMFYVLMDGILFGFLGGWAGGAVFGNQQSDLLPVISPDLGGMLPGQNIDEASNPLELMNICGTATQQEKDAQISIVDALQDEWKTSESADWKKASLPMADGFFKPDGPIGNLAMLMVFTLVTPFFGLMVTLAAFKYFSPLLGGDMEISVLSRLI